MGFYGDRVLPRILDVACGAKAMNPLRERVCAGLTGEVIEIGFGSGLNMPFYPPAVKRIAAVEPADLGWRLAARRLAASPIVVERSGLDGQSLPYGDATFDAALSTFTLCTIPDAVAALQELARVLKPGGTLHFLEHGLAPDEKVQRFQRRIEPIHRPMFGGCRITRPIADMVTGAGFTITGIETFYEKSAPKYGGAVSLGTAVAV
jgi:ubiquinone/menaquinone biosynthesis C-methylase UbiE